MAFHLRAVQAPLGKQLSKGLWGLAGFLVNRRWVRSEDMSLWFLETSPKLRARGEEKGQEDVSWHCILPSLFSQS